MMPGDLKDTTMNPATRTLAGVVLDEQDLPAFESLVETLMGKKANSGATTSNAKFVKDVDV